MTHTRLSLLLFVAACSSQSDSSSQDEANRRRHHPPDLGSTADLSPPPPPPNGVSSGYFPAGALWYQDISNAAVDASSQAIISRLQAAGGWGNGNRFDIDLSITVLHADATTPMQTFQPTADFYSPDCDLVPMPVPAGGAVEGESGYACTMNGDCHLLVVHPPTQKLYEMWRANIVGGVFQGGCLAVWDMTQVYPANGRGDQCTSADAAGYPIAPLLFTPDEVSQGAVNHALRFILPNDRISRLQYVHPSTHTAGSSIDASSVPYGARFRLRADFPLASLPSSGARAVAVALQRYGMFLADGGNIALTGMADQFTQTKWSGLLGTHDLELIQVTDFVMVDGGARIPYNGNCVRN
jgi:serine/threonine-protein kinase